MTLPSEVGNTKTESVIAGSDALMAPMRLLQSGTRGARSVSALEFHEVAPLSEASQVESHEDIGEESAEARLKAEVAELDARLKRQTKEALAELEVVRHKTRAEAREEWLKDLEDKVRAERAVVVEVCERFAQERARYFAAVEEEIVNLALAIAARVLHRETSMDPLVLSAAVRVALEKIATDSTAVLRVPAAETEMWRKIVESTGSSVQLVGEERMSAGECVLETNVGRVELGVAAQLREIERGFFDLLKQRPA